VLDKVTKLIDIVSYGFVILCTVGMVVSTFLQVFFRYILGHPLYWSEELSRYFFVWIVFIGASIAVKEGAHIGVDYLVKFLSPRVNKILFLAINLIVVAFILLVIIEAVPVVSVNMGQRSPAIGIPMGIVYLSIPIGLGFALLHIIIKSIQAVCFPKSIT